MSTENAIFFAKLTIILQKQIKLLAILEFIAYPNIEPGGATMKKLEQYIPLIEFMGIVFGNNFEIILHDVSKPEASIIAIKNGTISGRDIGGPMTDLALRMMEENDFNDKNFITNYEGKTKDGRILVSSTYYIRENNELIGMLCVNHDASSILEAEKCIQKLKKSFNLNKDPEYSEHLDDSIIHYSDSLIQTTIDDLKISPHKLSVKEKIAVIRQLDQQGVFSTKGSKAKLAHYFKTSESTIYRYIIRARKIQD